MAVTNIPNVQNWTVTPQNGQVGYFTLMNTWLGQSTLVIASLQTAIVAQNEANEEINALAIQAENNAIIATGLANYQGEWSGVVSYSKGWSVSGGGLYYTSKVDSNLNHLITDTNYWLPNPINDKVSKTENGTILGTITFSTSPVVPTPTTTGNVITMDNIIQKTAVGIGYGVGSGGTVTQLTSKSTAVTLNKPTGQITMNNATLAAGAKVAFVVNNSLITDKDTLILSTSSSSDNNDAYTLSSRVLNGLFIIRVINTHVVSLSESVVINFEIIKGANS